jgi:hypothetical protein
MAKNRVQKPIDFDKKRNHNPSTILTNKNFNFIPTQKMCDALHMLESQMLANWVFIGVLHFQMGSLAFMHALFHCYLLLPDFLIQVIGFCKVDYAFFNNTSFMPTQSFVSFMACWHAFDIAWSKQKLA